LAESTALIVKVFSGVLSDYLGKRKGLALGYALGVLTKPLFAIATTASLLLTARLLDRIGKGVRGAPRDALVAGFAPSHMRGAAFGLRLHRSSRYSASPPCSGAAGGLEFKRLDKD
jgi:MFS family permease